VVVMEVICCNKIQSISLLHYFPSLGALGGAALGTAFFPVIGTIVGGICGAIGGAIGGSVGATAVAESIGDACEYNMVTKKCKACGKTFKIRQYRGEKDTQLCPKCA
jgi:outer membrane lipoprotein SlyB